MRYFSERYKDVVSFQLWTYEEVLTVENGFAETTNPYTINVLTSYKWGFVEVLVETPVEAGEETPVEAGEETKVETGVETKVEADEETDEEKKRTKKRPAKRRAGFVPKKAGSALGMNDVDAFTGRH